MNFVKSSKMDCDSGKTTEKPVVSKQQSAHNPATNWWSTPNPARRSRKAPRKYHDYNFLQTELVLFKNRTVIKKRVQSREQCVTESHIAYILTHLPLQNPSEHKGAPEDAMQIDLVPELPPSRGYENIVTAMDVFSRYLLAYPTSHQDAKSVAIIIFNIVTKFTQLPTTFISVKDQPLCLT